MLTFAGDFWTLFWTVIAAGAALTVLVTMAIGASWQEKREHDATLIELAAAYNATAAREHANAA